MFVGKIDDTVRLLEETAKEKKAVAVAYSDGKDSRVIIDLCIRTFESVEAFYMYYIPDLEFINEKLRVAEKRYGITIHQLPHEGLTDSLRRGVYCDPRDYENLLPDVKLRDIYNLAKHALGVDLVVTGAKASDSSWRRRYFHATRTWTDMVYPIKDWNKHDVLGYLRARNIPMPDGSGLNASGVSLIPAELLWIYDNHPNDFKKVCEYFPYAEAVVWRRTFYGT